MPTTSMSETSPQKAPEAGVFYWGDMSRTTLIAHQGWASPRPRVTCMEGFLGQSTVIRLGLCGRPASKEPAEAPQREGCRGTQEPCGAEWPRLRGSWEAQGLCKGTIPTPPPKAWEQVGVTGQGGEEESQRSLSSSWWAGDRCGVSVPCQGSPGRFRGTEPSVPQVPV